MPGEWEPHRATWISWPHHEPDWPGKLGELEPLVLEVARTADPTTQPELARRVRALARDYEDVYAGWEGEIDRVLELDFE